MPAILFNVSIFLSVASFVLFAVLALTAAWAKPKAAPATEDEIQRLGFQDAAKMATQFATAGPTATAAALSIFFMFVALAVSGYVKFAVEPAAEAAEKTDA